MLEKARTLRNGLKVVILSHIDNLGDAVNPEWKLKTAGKMLNSQLNVDGLFTYVLYTAVQPGEDGRAIYKFRTNTVDGTDTCKTPLGCFSDLYIDNDLDFVFKKIDEYNG